MNSSSHQLTSTVKTRFNPCVIEYLKPTKKRTTDANLQSFIIGTYELVEEGSELAKQYTDLSDRNNRLGTLEVLKVDDNNSRVVLTYECQFGGVFDLRLIPGHDHPKCSEETGEDKVIDYRIVVAHANGFVALYLLTQRDEPKIELLKSWNTQTKMLTTVEVSLIKGHCTFYAGSEDGQLVRVMCTTITGDDNDEGNVTRKLITDFGHPIWYIRAWSAPTNEDDNNDHPFLLFVGSEDSKWRVLNEESNELLYTNTDAASGITSFEFLPSSSREEIKVLVGSYDEYMRLYRILHSNSNSKLSIDSASLLYRIHIEGGGIWRMRAYTSASSQIKILTAAMYAGVCLLTFDVKKIENLPTLDEKKCDDTSEACTSVLKLSVPSSEDQSTTEKLIYGLSSSDDLSTVTFASFYEKELYILKAQKETYAIDSVDSFCQSD